MQVQASIAAGIRVLTVSEQGCFLRKVVDAHIPQLPQAEAKRARAQILDDVCLAHDAVVDRLGAVDRSFDQDFLNEANARRTLLLEDP